MYLNYYRKGNRGLKIPDLRTCLWESQNGNFTCPDFFAELVLCLTMLIYWAELLII